MAPDELNDALRRWTGAGALDAAAAQRIRELESQSSRTEKGLRWPVYIALAAGGLLLGSGLILFASSQWQRLSPFGRCAVLSVSVIVLHAMGTFANSRGLALTFHALATLCLGLAISLGAQALAYDQHRAAQLFIWLLGSLLAYVILRDWLQLAFLALLTPAWIVVAAQRFKPDIAAGAFLLALGFTYLSSEFLDRTEANRIVLAWLGGLTLPIAVIVAVSGINGRAPLPWLAAATLLPLIPAFLLRGPRTWVNATASAWVFILVLLAVHNAQLGVYVWSAIGAAGLSAWGAQEHHIERINVGMAGFLVTLLFFFFSNVMDKVGRSASLILLGAVFLTAGWSLERVRRRLVEQARAS